MFEVLDGTWPAAAVHAAGPWLVREGRGGGRRVSSATVASEGGESWVGAVEAAHQSLGQPPLFCLRGGQEGLDRELASQGYRIADPVVMYSIPTAVLASEPPARLSTFPIWPPLAIMTEIWADGDIGPERLSVMGRVTGKKTSILGRAGDRAAGAGFVAIHGDVAMVHALQVLPDQRRQGLARNMMRAAAVWASGHGAGHIALAVTKANSAANALYAGLGMHIVDHYHYRVK